MNLKYFCYSIHLIILINFTFGDIIVTLPYGKISGKEKNTDNNVMYYSFQGIPYASPPVGKLRFKSPINPKNWNGILDTKKLPSECMQWSVISEKNNEDCLYLNIFTPAKPGTLANNPVYVYFHGGRFHYGSGGARAQWFLEQNIIVVKINYRLGPFGFISTGDSIIPGNYGLKDQNFALQWIQRNIYLFGGDSKKVTIGGQSAGAASAGYHIISQKSSGLFRAAIMESGSPVTSSQFQPSPKKYAYQLAKAIDKNFSTKNSTTELLELLQNIPASQLNSVKLPNEVSYQLGQGHAFAPVVELETEDAFISKPMDESLKQGLINKVPIIIGINSEERLSEAKNLTSFKMELVEFDKNLSLIVHDDFNVNLDDKIKFGELLRNVYTNGEKFSNNLAHSIALKSDSVYTTSVIRYGYLQSKYTNVFMYEFSYHGQLGENNFYLEGAEKVEHNEELCYLWYKKNLSSYPPEDIQIKERMVTLWSNFIKYLNPTPSEDELFQNIIWPKSSRDNLVFLNINKTLEIQVNPKKYREWEAIVQKYGHGPFETY